MPSGGSYSGQETSFQIDDSGHQATLFEVTVNSPGKSVALILGAYEPSVWNISWTEGTKITTVFASGYHRQAIAGLPQATPTTISSYDNGSPCGDLYVSEENVKQVEQLSKQLFNTSVQSVQFANDGNLVLGDKLTGSENLLTSQDTPTASYFDISAPLAGEAGITDLVSQGLIREVSAQDTQRWEQEKGETLEEEMRPQFLILQQITVPAGLFGANSVSFFLDNDVPAPQGELGHSALYDFNTMTCTGVGCSSN